MESSDLKRLISENLCEDQDGAISNKDWAEYDYQRYLIEHSGTDFVTLPDIWSDDFVSYRYFHQELDWPYGIMTNIIRTTIPSGQFSDWLSNCRDEKFLTLQTSKLDIENILATFVDSPWHSILESFFHLLKTKSSLLSLSPATGESDYDILLNTLAMLSAEYLRKKLVCHYVWHSSAFVKIVLEIENLQYLPPIEIWKNGESITTTPNPNLYFKLIKGEAFCDETIANKDVFLRKKKECVRVFPGLEEIHYVVPIPFGIRKQPENPFKTSELLLVWLTEKRVRDWWTSKQRFYVCDIFGQLHDNFKTAMPTVTWASASAIYALSMRGGGGVYECYREILTVIASRVLASTMEISEMYLDLWKDPKKRITYLPLAQNRSTIKAFIPYELTFENLPDLLLDLVQKLRKSPKRQTYHEVSRVKKKRPNVDYSDSYIAEEIVSCDINNLYFSTQHPIHNNPATYKIMAIAASDQDAFFTLLVAQEQNVKSALLKIWPVDTVIRSLNSAYDVQDDMLLNVVSNICLAGLIKFGYIYS